MQDLQKLLEQGLADSFESNIPQDIILGIKKFIREKNNQAKLESQLIIVPSQQEAKLRLLKIKESFKKSYRKSSRDDLLASKKIIFLLDLRDIDPQEFAELGAVLSLDNRHPIRASLYIKEIKDNKSQNHQIQNHQSQNHHSNRIIFYDTLAHPQAKLDDILYHSLISPSLLNRNNSKQVIKRKAVVYAGSLSPALSLIEAFSELLLKIKMGLDNNASDEILYFATKKPPAPLANIVSFQKPDSHHKFLDIIAETKFVFCYPGMTLLETWFLTKVPIMFATASKVHNELSSYLQREAKLLYIEGIGDCNYQKFLKNYNAKKLKFNSASSRPKGKGYLLLLKKLEQLLL